VFGKTKKLEMLAWIAEQHRPLLESNDVEAIVRAAQSIRSRWSDAGHPEGSAVDLARALERRAEALKLRPFAERVRTCPWCSGRLFRVSSEQSIEGMPVRVRLIGCEGCGAISMFSTDVKAITPWGPVVAVKDGSGGPFR
jgi:hypothetical protein